MSFLRHRGVCLRMLMVNFYDGKGRHGGPVPSLAEWWPIITETDQRLGHLSTSVLTRRIYQAFLPAV